LKHIVKVEVVVGPYTVLSHGAVDVTVSVYNELSSAKYPPK
jgi:hypothetical protein